MQDIANNNRLINTAENLPHPKRPFNKLPIVISLEILLAIYTFICFSLKPTHNGKFYLFVFFMFMLFFAVITLASIIISILGQCYERFLVCRLIIRGLYVVNLIFFFDEFYSNSNWYLIFIPIIFSLLVISELWHYIDINRDYSQMVI